MKTLNILFAAMAAIVAVSCNKDAYVAERKLPGHCEPISFKVEGVNMDLSTKVTPVTDLASFNVMASTGAVAYETYAWTVVATKSGDSYITNKYWPSTDPSYHFYAANTSLSFMSNGATVTVDSSEDIVCAYKSSPQYGVPTLVNFRHILTRIGTATISIPAGYSISDASIGIKKIRTSGTYNLRTKGWTGTNEIQMQPVQEGSNDLYFIPGQYDVSVTFTLTKGDFTGTYTSVTNVDFQPEKINNLEINIVKDPAVLVSFSVTVIDWEAKSVPVTLT